MKPVVLRMGVAGRGDSLLIALEAERRVLAGVLFLAAARFALVPEVIVTNYLLEEDHQLLIPLLGPKMRYSQLQMSNFW